MKILLVNPPIPKSYYNREFYLPSSLIYLGAVLRHNGDEVQILDMNVLKIHDRADASQLYERKLLQEVDTFRPALIGFGCLFSGNFTTVLRYAALCKEHDGSIDIVVGGIHVTIHAADILKHCPAIDWLVLSEGEISMVQLVNAIKSGRNQWDYIDGIAYRQDGRSVIQPKQHYIEDLDTLPIPAYDLIRMEDYFVDTSAWYNPKGQSFDTSIPIISSRSCPNRCTFCSMYLAMGPHWRARSAGHVADEIEYIVKTYGQTHFSFMDDNFTFSKARTLAICTEIQQRGLDIQFETPNGLSMKTLDAEVLDALVHAGLVRVSLAIESGSEFIRNKVMRKHLKQDKIFEIINLTKQYPRLYVKAFFIIGMPEETEETLEATYQMIRAIDVDRVYIQNIVPFPGTRIFEQAVRDHLLVDVDLRDIYLSDIMYITNYDRFFIKPYQLSLEQLQMFRRRCEQLINEQQLSKLKTPIETVDAYTSGPSSSCLYKEDVSCN